MDKQFNGVFIYLAHTYSALCTKTHREVNHDLIKTAVDDCCPSLTKGDFQIAGQPVILEPDQGDNPLG